MVGDERADHPRQNAQLPFEHRDIDELSAPGRLARVQRREYAECRIHPSRDVGNRHAGVNAATAGLAGDAHHSALRLHDEIERRTVAVRSVLPETGDRAVHDARLPLANALVVDAELCDGPDAKVLEHDVGALEQPEEDRFAFRMLEIERDALLVAIEVDEVRRLAAVERRPPRARDLAAERLDLDHLRAIVAEHRRRERSGERVRQIEHDDVAEGPSTRRLVTLRAGIHSSTAS